ncbi:PREDICTED: 11-beta-hydroxysteroid dehydrogenase 1B-like [Ipomoea nil]|uniref:11-beta-hydroxysteroid dehydrogenase 1B-like n=1 Tax=Ipomoea nil TaxID=35883 RepID=UPI000901670D|nr:PREDICTED: 11-beta-hydroxysteroid dehydrogenase 1B-like [Ipomoea nil]
MMLDIIHKFLNLVAPPITFFSLLLFWPPFQVFKFFLSILSSIFAEDVAGKVVIITGASSGIGEHLAYEYAKRGVCLALAARRERSLEEVAKAAVELGAPDAIAIQADVSNVDDCKRIVDQTISRFGRLDHLVNNAGTMCVSSLEEAEDVTNFRSVMDINFWGSVYMTRFAAPYLRKNDGRIIAISSFAEWLPVPRMSVYNASKAAVFQFFETLRIEFGADIKITLVTPGFIESELTQGKHLDKDAQLDVNTDVWDAQMSIMPVEKVEGCAKAILDGACRGERYVTHPTWFKVTQWWKVFFPEVVEGAQRLLDISWPGSPAHETLGKKILELTSANKLIYPDTIQPETVQKAGPKAD